MQTRIPIRALLGALGLVCALSVHADEFTLNSKAIREGERLSQAQVFSGFGCDGENVSPALSWSGAPGATKSFAVTVYDPDAPTGSGWWHWTLFNIPAPVTQLKENAGDPNQPIAPKGSTQGMTDFAKPGFGGACPPEGDKPHRYVFTVYALDTEKLPLDTNAPGAMVGYYLHKHAIAKAVITARYAR